MRRITTAVLCLVRAVNAGRLYIPNEQIQGSRNEKLARSYELASRTARVPNLMKTLARLLLASAIGPHSPGSRNVASKQNSDVSRISSPHFLMLHGGDASYDEGASHRRDGAKSLWFRCDLRLDDQLALQAAIGGSTKTLLPIFVFDPAKFRTPTLAGAVKSSARRARFLLESVASLRKELESRGSGLVVGIGSPPEVIKRFCESSSEVYVTQGICSEESDEESRVEQILHSQNSRLNRIWGGTLYMPSECGNDLEDMPLLFTNFRTKAESRGRVRYPVAAPKRLPPLPDFGDDIRHDVEEALQFMPSLEDLGYSSDEAKLAMQDDPRAVMPFVGGEKVALKRLQKWMFEDDRLKEYFDIRNGMLGEGYSSKLSPWLALGCISPRRIYTEAKRYEKERVKNKSTYWLVFELIWRDFYMYMAHCYGDRLFIPGGITGMKTSWRGGDKALSLWKQGRTKDKLVDANMRELAATGFMSNRGRQNVASYLIFNLGVDWRYGAAHFEELLLDYDPCANWGNWMAAAGLTGQRINKFNTKKQLAVYDPELEYVNCWLPGSPGSAIGGKPQGKGKPKANVKRKPIEPGVGKTPRQKERKGQRG